MMVTSEAEHGSQFCRIWELSTANPTCTRHTFISHALASGMNPMEVAQITGHDLQTLYDNYAGYVNKTPQLFDF